MPQSINPIKETTDMGLPQASPSTTPASREDKPTTQTQTHHAIGAGANTGAGVTREKTAAEIEADRLYEERMDEEYAKRDGGA